MKKTNENLTILIVLFVISIVIANVVGARTISFGLGLGWLWSPQGRADLVGIMIGQYLLKACLALLDTPFFYFFTRKPRQQ